MPETKIITFSHKEVATALIKSQNIHEGIWALYIEFGLSAANIGSGPSEVVPAAIIPVVKIGIQRAAAINNLSVDAAEVNPLGKTK